MMYNCSSLCLLYKHCENFAPLNIELNYYTSSCIGAPCMLTWEESA